MIIKPIYDIAFTDLSASTREREQMKKKIRTNGFCTATLGVALGEDGKTPG